DLALEPILELAELPRRQLVIDDDYVDVGFGAGSGQTGDLAGADEGPGVRLGSLLQHPQRDGGAGGVGEAGQLFERLLSIHASNGATDQTDERCALPKSGLLHIA